MKKIYPIILALICTISLLGTANIAFAQRDGYFGCRCPQFTGCCEGTKVCGCLHKTTDKCGNVKESYSYYFCK